MTDEAIGGDLADLRKEFGDEGWQFSTMWATAGAGPDARRLTASRGTVLLTAWSAPELRMKIRHEQHLA